MIHAPQGRAPVVMSSLVPPLSAVSRPDSKPDFIRGFGLDIPEEEEEEEEEEYDHRDRDRMEDDDEDDGERDEGTEEGEGTAPHSRHHSRHESRLSAALSLRSFGGLVAEGLNERFGVSESDDRNRDGRTDLKIEVRPADGTLEVPNAGHMMPRRNTLGAVVPPPGLVSSTGQPIGAPVPKGGHTPAGSGDANEGDRYADEEFEGVDEWTGSEDVYDQYESEEDNEVGLRQFLSGFLPFHVFTILLLAFWATRRISTCTSTRFHFHCHLSSFIIIPSKPDGGLFHLAFFLCTGVCKICTLTTSFSFLSSCCPSTLLAMPTSTRPNFRSTKTISSIRHLRIRVQRFLRTHIRILPTFLPIPIPILTLNH